MAREQDFVSDVRTQSRIVWDAFNVLRSLQAESTAKDYGNTLPDGEGANAGITRAEVMAVVSTTTDALTTLLNAGHATNLARLL